MRLLIPTLCGAALLAGTVQASAHEHRGHMGHHMRSGGVVERNVGPSVSVRVGDRGYRNGYYGSSFYGYGPAYGYGPSYGYTSYSYGPSYGYRSVGVRSRVDLDDDDDCD